MKKTVLIATAIVAMLASTALAKKSNDPVLMNANGKDITVAEFNYLYNKNNTQQSQKQPLDEYLEMFKTYKLKVADAEAAGIDTTAAFKKEFIGYRNELARPYLRDTAATTRLQQEAYLRMLEDVDVSHIMIDRGKTPEEELEQKARLDSIRTEIVSNGADFAEMADKFSIDPGKARNHGHMGWITANQYPYSFELAAYYTPVGSISNVIETDFGYHIVKVNDKRPARGTVMVQHILKLFPRGQNVENSPEVKAAIDSIYQVIINGADFDAVARAESQDPGSARNGGRLPRFGTGRMVKEFEDMSFSIEDGEVSKPFATSYGWHIVKRLEHEPVGTFNESLEKINSAINADIRSQIPYTNKVEQLRAKYHSKVDPKGRARISKAITEANKLDSAVILSLANDKTPLLLVGKKKYNVGEAIVKIPVPAPLTANGGQKTVDMELSRQLDELTLEAEREALLAEREDYRNLVNEYRDGMLLFEVSNRNVWDKAAKDKAGLAEYFNNNRDKYNFSEPKFKGYIVFTPNDSIESEVKAFIATTTLSADSVAPVLRRTFGRDIKVEKVIASKGENAIVDAVAFGGERPEPTTRWTNYFTINGKMITAPEEPADVRGAVTSDYQNYLEQLWVNDLKQKYPIVVNEKVLNTLR